MPWEISENEILEKVGKVRHINVDFALSKLLLLSNCKYELQYKYLLVLNTADDDWSHLLLKCLELLFLPFQIPFEAFNQVGYEARSDETLSEPNHSLDGASVLRRGEREDGDESLYEKGSLV